MNANQRLEEAVRAGDLRRVRLALGRGAEVNHETLHEAARRGDLEVLKALLAAATRRVINRVDAEGYTPLMRAVEAGHLQSVKLLLEAGADPDAGTTEQVRETALRIAAAHGTYQMAEALLAAGADPLIPGRLMLTAYDRARERRTPDGRRITNLIFRMLERRAAENRARMNRTAKSHKRMSGRK